MTDEKITELLIYEFHSHFFLFFFFAFKSLGYYANIKA